MKQHSILETNGKVSTDKTNRHRRLDMIGMHKFGGLNGSLEPFRALSLTRLNDARDVQMDIDPDMYKCPSFPRLANSKGRRMSQQPRSPSTTHLSHTNSVLSGQQSLDNILQETYHESKHLHRRQPHHHAKLLRSSSAKTMGTTSSDALPPIDHKVSPLTRPLSATPSIDSDMFHRSTSCPAMSCPRSPRVPNTNNNRHHRQNLPAYKTDINLEGEVITDLPVEPTQDFPDFFPDSDNVADTDHLATVEESEVLEEHPMHTRRVKERHEPFRYIHLRDNRHRDRHSYVNIGDIPTSLAQKVISEHDTYEPESPNKAQQKCLKWLCGLKENKK